MCVGGDGLSNGLSNVLASPPPLSVPVKASIGSYNTPSYLVSVPSRKKWGKFCGKGEKGDRPGKKVPKRGKKR